MHKQIIRYVVNEPEVITPAKLLYEFTFPELLETMKPVVDEKGHLWAGKDRKQNLQDEAGKIALWRAWQQSFKTHASIPQKAMDYFQNTKHLSRPPREGDIGLSDKKALFVPIQEVERPRFSWSPSKLNTFDICPYQFAKQHYYKTLPYQETAATIWGVRVHEQAERFMKGEDMTDPEAFALVEKWVKTLAKIPGERFIEHKIGVDSKGIPCDYATAEGRMILDFGVKWDDKMLLVDYKTGKQKADDTQLKIYALFMAMAHPEVQTITYKYIWLKDGVATGAEIKRSEIAKIGQELSLKIKTLRDAWENENFPQRKGGLCKNWCGVKECPHCGR